MNVRGGIEMSWEGVIINIEQGDIITSKKGILTETIALHRKVINKKMKYLGNGAWEAMDESIELKNVKVVK